MPQCSGTSSPCPILDPEQSDNGVKITMPMISDHIDFNICTNPAICDCSVNADVKQSPEIVAGENSVLELGSITLTNTGDEPSIENRLTISIDPPGLATKFRFNTNSAGFGSCRETNNAVGEIACDLPFLNVTGVDNDSKRTFRLDATPLEIIDPSIKSVGLKLKMTAKCSGNKIYQVSSKSEFNSSY